MDNNNGNYINNIFTNKLNYYNMEQDKIDSLSVFTLEELQDEIKRRKKAEKKEPVKRDLKAKYFEWEGKVINIWNHHLPIYCISFQIKSDELLERKGISSGVYYVKPGIFNKSNMPKVGDTVVLATRIRKNDRTLQISNSKIVRIK